MTDAMKAMVEAMAAEIERLTDGEVHLGDDGRTAVPGKFAGNFPYDLEKVARAGLAAIRELPEGLWEDGGALDPDVIGYDRAPETYWEAILDAILKETPRP